MLENLAKELTRSLLARRCEEDFRSGLFDDGTLGHEHDSIGDLPRESQPGARLRLQRITKWHKRAGTFLPLAQKLLQGE